MVKINWTKEAEDRLTEIYNYISKDNPDAASKVVNEIYKKVQVLKNFPEIGYKYEHTSGFHIRILLYGHYTIAYWYRVTIEFLVKEGHVFYVLS